MQTKTHFLHSLYLLLLLVALSVFLWEWQFRHVLFHKGNISAEIAGDDRIVWKNTPTGVVAERVHPLLQQASEPYRLSQIPEYIEAGDKLRKIDYNEIYRAGTVDTIVGASAPGNIFIFQIERKNQTLGTMEISEPFVINSYRLSFSFNENGNYWRIMLWVSILASFVLVLVMLILLPLLREKRTDNRILRNLMWAAIAFFALQSIRYLYWVVQYKENALQFEKAFFVLYVLFSFLYSLFYVWYYVGKMNVFWRISSFVLGAIFVFFTYKIIFLDKELKYFAPQLECLSYFIFCLHILGGNIWAFLQEKNLSLRRKSLQILASVMALAGLIYFPLFALNSNFATQTNYENATFVFALLQFYPIFGAASQRLKFGKVSLVVNQTLQYIIFFAVALFSYLLVNQVFQFIFAGNPYLSILEVVSSIVLIMLIRAIYLSNEKSIRKYFILSQQQKEDKIRVFLSKIPQYTAANKLYEDFEQELSEYLTATNLKVLWKGDLAFGEHLSEKESLFFDAAFNALAKEQTLWARNKEISGFYFAENIEVKALEYALIFSIPVHTSNYGLLLIDRKKGGVYNLADVEIIAQILQQIRLTLSVLQLIQREKELLEETYKANLTALRAQINPHFLFNTLNTIASLIQDSPDLAEAAVEKLAFIFRYTLKVSDQNFVPLYKEIDLVRTYLEIEQIRFGSRLAVHIEVEDEVKDIEIPAFVLQTLVENCIKHGIAKITTKGEVSIIAYPEDDFLKIEVYDNGVGIVPERVRKGTGLNNIIVRLENIYELPDVIVFENTGNGTLVSLKIPM